MLLIDRSSRHVADNTQRAPIHRGSTIVFARAPCLLGKAGSIDFSTDPLTRMVLTGVLCYTRFGSPPPDHPAQTQSKHGLNAVMVSKDFLRLSNR
jgi:hypothetical protein